MNIIPVVKTIVGAAASLSSGYVVGHAVKAVTPENLKLAGKITTVVGGFLIATVAGDLTAKYVEDQVDQFDAGLRIGKKIAMDRFESSTGDTQSDDEVAPVD